MKIIDIIKEAKIYGIIREDDPQKAVEIANAYIEGGIKLIEFNCPVDVLAKFKDKKDILLSQGGVITTAQAEIALKNGASIISSPIFQANLIRYTTCHNAFLLPSVTTANEAYATWKSRIALTKIYPVAEMGGVEYIKDIVRPMPFLSLMPCGFVKIEDIKAYLNAGAVAVAIGREFYQKESYHEIVKTVKEAIKTI